MSNSETKDAERILPGKSVGKIVRSLEREMLGLRKRNGNLERENAELKESLLKKRLTLKNAFCILRVEYARI